MAPIKKAILVISDFHLGPGKASGEHDHFDQDSEFSDFLRYYGRQQKYDQIELVINGDFFDSIQIAVSGKLLSRVYAEQAHRKICRAIDGHPRVFDSLKEFLSFSGRCITFVVGNHDPALAFTEVQRLLSDRIGGKVTFSVGPVARGAVFIQHGNDWDAANRFDEQLLLKDQEGEFVKFPWGSYLVIDFVSKIRRRVPDIEKIKPLGAFFRWALMNRPRDAFVALIGFILFLLRHRFHSQKEARFSFGQVRQIMKGTCYSCDFVEQALLWFRDKPSGILICGHTHRALLANVSDTQLYANCGTWNPILVFQAGKFYSHLHRSFILIETESSEFLSDNIVKLLEWVSGQEPISYVPSFQNTHMHPPMGGEIRQR
jgi:UDP-2,3-diacylglucosamine pyrophosphatase LpxH